MDYVNTTNDEFLVDPKVLFHGWWIYSYLHISWSSDCHESVQISSLTTLWHGSYCMHTRYSMSRRKNGILINEHALKRESLPFNQNRKREIWGGYNKAKSRTKAKSLILLNCVLFLHILFILLKQAHSFIQQAQNSPSHLYDCKSIFLPLYIPVNKST